MNKLLTIFTCLNILTATNSYGAGLGGTVYVPNLHAKCLSSHQTCILECAANPNNTCNNTSINKEALTCANSCVEEYRACEDLLNKLRCLNKNAPIRPKKVDMDTILQQIEEEHKYNEDG